jgi:hypothetical protein
MAHYDPVNGTYRDEVPYSASAPGTCVTRDMPFLCDTDGIMVSVFNGLLSLSYQLVMAGNCQFSPERRQRAHRLAMSRPWKMLPGSEAAAPGPRCT